MPASGRSRGHPRRGFLAIALLVQLVLVLLPQPAAAQATPDVCFQVDDDGDADTTEDVVFRCAADMPGGANYMQGDVVDIKLQEVSTGAWVRVRCLTDCHDTEGKSYFARYTAGATLRFPRDFTDPAGANARSDRAPRYNSSWEASVLLTTGGAPIARGTFHVWLFDLHTSPGLTVMPGERHSIRAAGFDEGADVRLGIERRAANGSWVSVPTPTGSLAKVTGGGFDNWIWFSNAWVVPKDEAKRIAECGGALDGCYRFVVKGAGKDDEFVPFRVSPATFVVSRFNSVGNAIDHQPDGPRPPAVERTAEVFVAVDLRFPGGRAAQGDPLTGDDVLPSPVTKQPTLRVRVERVNVTASLPVQEVPMTYNPLQSRWEARWTVPKDFTLSSAEPDAHYRLKLLQDKDKNGNRVPEVVLANHTVSAATITPKLAAGFRQVGRTEEANFSFDVRYHNGSLVTPDDLQAPLRGCFVRDASGDPLNCAGVDKVTGVFEHEKWVFKVRYPRAYAFLEAHRFHLMSDGEDKWGNGVAPFRSEPYVVAIGSPRIAFSTVIHGRAEEAELERGGGPGNYVSVQAVITYADGSPFNRQVNVNESPTITATLIKRGPAEDVASQRDLLLREVDSSSGRWLGDLVLTADDTETPLGRWTFKLDVRDNLTVPNANGSTFDRRIVGIPLIVEPVRQPFGLIETESTQSFRFRVLYQDGNPVPHADLVDRIQAYVLRYNPANGSVHGNPVSGRLVPQHDEYGGWYHVDFKVPTTLFSGTYAFVVTGGDRHDNLLARASYSREFSTTSKTLERPVLTQPPPDVRRGESATVVFDAREGDVGLAGTGHAQVVVERFDVSLGQWVRERTDARQTSPDLLDHVGLFPVTLTTPGGLYRFALDGRDANLQRITATSANFSIVATEVPRVILAPPAETVVKGGSVSFLVERQDGDRYTDARVLLNGRANPTVDGQPVVLPLPILIPSGASVNVTWEVPFEAPTGNYSLLVFGQDLYGNRIEILSPAVEAQAAQLSGRILGQPSRSVARGESTTMLFGITYPTGAFYVAPQLPTVQVVNESGFVGFADVRPGGLTYVATWSPPADLATGEYRFEITGTGIGGNAFPSLRSNAFRVLAGVVTRTSIADIGANLERMSTGVFSFPYQPGDQFVEFKVGYYGVVSDASDAFFDTGEPRTTTTLAHTLDTVGGAYVSRFLTDQETPPGLYRIHATGEDGFGNEIRARSALFTVRPTSLVVLPDTPPGDEAFQEGVPITLSFVARYRSGAVMDEGDGRPSAVVLYTAPGRTALPVTDRPTVEFRDGRWYATWTPPEDLPDGVYEFSFGGTDSAGNTIASSKSKAYVVTTTLGGSAAKLLPGPGAGHALVVLVVVALGVAAWRGRERR